MQWKLFVDIFLVFFSIQGEKDRFRHEWMLFWFEKKKEIEKKLKGYLWFGGCNEKIIRKYLSFSSRLCAIQGNKDRGHEYLDLKIGIGTKGKEKNWESEGGTFLWFHPSDFF